MKLVKKIIGWLISLFHMIFKKNKNKTLNSSQKNNKIVKNKSNVKVVTIIDETMPGYMYLSNNEKDLLLNRVKNVKKIMNKKSDEYLNQEILELSKLLDNCVKNDDKDLLERVSSFKNNLSKGIDKNTNKEFELLLNYIPSDKKEEITLKYYATYDDCNLINNSAITVDNLIDEIGKKDITILEKYNIIDAIENFENSKSKNILEDIDNYNKDVFYIIKNANKNIVDKVKLNYKKVNYVTMTTELLDDINIKLKEIEENYSNHRYNKFYYEREIEKIKKQILELKDLKNKPIVYNEILKLRKELYTKSKDKYDILYNNEFFLNINKRCDDLINKVNAKVVDIKKEKTKDKSHLSSDDYLENILLRYQDMALARQIILDTGKISFSNDKEMILYIKRMYDDFVLDDMDVSFNFERNKEKTALVKLFNSLNKVNCYLSDDKYILIEHINFKLDDLIDAVKVKKEKLNATMIEKYNIDISNDLVEEKISKLALNEKQCNEKKFIKKNVKNSDKN